jgi:hypothetical protein
MCAGTIIVSAGLVALSQVRDPASYLAVWAVLGIGMRCCLYDAAFAALVQVTPSPRPKGDLLSHALRRLRLDGVLGDRPLFEPSLWLAGHAHSLCRHQLVHLSAAQLASRAAIGRWTRRPWRTPHHLRRMPLCSKGGCTLLGFFCLL